MNGRFWIDRKIFIHEIWQNVPAYRLFILLIGRACFKDGVTISGTVLKRGQYLRSIRQLQKDLHYKKGRGEKTYGINTIRRAIELLQRNTMITVSETVNGTLFTVVNYEKYQKFPDSKKGIHGTDNGTGKSDLTVRKGIINGYKKNKGLINAVDVTGQPLKEIV